VAQGEGPSTAKKKKKQEGLSFLKEPVMWKTKMASEHNGMETPHNMSTVSRIHDLRLRITVLNTPLNGSTLRIP
jgi:hypothetical protein